MSELSSFLESLEVKVKQTEANVANALAQYHGLTGILTGLQNALSEAKAVANVVAPSSSVAATLDVASEVVSAAEAIDASPVAEDVPQ